MSPPKKSYTILNGSSSKGQASIAFQATHAALRGTRILIIRACAIGDFVLNLPALIALAKAHPTARFTLVGYPAILALARDFIPVEAIHSIDVQPWSRLFQGPQKGLDFDAAFVWMKSPDVAENLRASGIADVRYWDPFPARDRHAAIHLLETVGLALPELPDAWKPQSGRILIHPGSGSPGKCWPHFEKFANEVADVEAIIGPCEENFLGRCPQLRNLTLIEVAAELRQCRRFIGNDSGITHLAAYLGCPTIALFGPTNPQLWGPVGRRVEVLWKSSLADIGIEEVSRRLNGGNSRSHR